LRAIGRAARDARIEHALEAGTPLALALPQPRQTSESNDRVAAKRVKTDDTPHIGIKETRT